MREFCIGLVTSLKDKKGMLEMPVVRKIKRDDFEYLYSDKVVCAKRLDKRSVTVVFSNAEGIATTSIASCQQKVSTSTIEIPCPDLIKIYKKGIGGVGIIDQRAAAYHLNQKPTTRFYLCIFFDLTDVACAKAKLFTI